MLHELKHVKRNISVFLALFCFSFTYPLSAHHSVAMFNLEKIVELKGTVKKFQFTNPHVWLHVAVADDKGETTVWRVEYLSPNILKRKGWNRKTFKPGDEISITVYPAKSGDPKGGFINAITADGKMLGKPVSEAGEGPAIK
jgi:uncharacterized protein DUF6152